MLFQQLFCHRSRLVCLRFQAIVNKRIHTSSLRHPRVVKFNSVMNENPIEKYPVDNNMQSPCSHATLLENITAIKHKDTNPVVKKCAEIMDKLNKEKSSAVVSEIAYRTNFGSIRFDDDNRPTYKSDSNFKTDNTANNCIVEDSEIDAQYFSEETNSSLYYKRHNSEILQATGSVDAHADEIIDHQYFGHALDKDVTTMQESEQVQIDHFNLHCKEDINNDKDLNFVDEFFFKDLDMHANILTKEVDKPEENLLEGLSDFEKSFLDVDEADTGYKCNSQFLSNVHTKDMEKILVESYKDHLEKHKSAAKKGVKDSSQNDNESVTNAIQDIVISPTNLFYQPPPQKAEQQNSAFEYALKLRREEKLNKLNEGKLNKLIGETSNDGKELPAFKKIIACVYDLQRSKLELQSMLQSSIIYNESKFI